MFHITKLKDKNHIIISTGIEKAFDKMHHPFWIKIFNRLNKEGNHMRHIYR